MTKYVSLLVVYKEGLSKKKISSYTSHFGRIIRFVLYNSEHDIQTKY